MTFTADPLLCRLAWLAFVGLALTIGAGNAPAQSDAASCAAVDHRQFDLWVGTRNAFAPSGKKIGENRIELIVDGCALPSGGW